MATNYRLGPLGFMSTSNDDLPANLGLWDQNLAMKWVQNHIEHFGGDPRKVVFVLTRKGHFFIDRFYVNSQTENLISN